MKLELVDGIESPVMRLSVGECRLIGAALLEKNVNDTRLADTFEVDPDDVDYQEMILRYAGLRTAEDTVVEPVTDSELSFIGLQLRFFHSGTYKAIRNIVELTRVPAFRNEDAMARRALGLRAKALSAEFSAARETHYNLTNPQAE